MFFFFLYFPIAVFYMFLHFDKGCMKKFSIITIIILILCGKNPHYSYQS